MKVCLIFWKENWTLWAKIIILKCEGRLKYASITPDAKLPIPSKHLLVLKTSSRRLQDISWRRLQHVFSVTILRLPRRLAKTFWRRLEDVLKTCLEDLLKILWRQTKYLLGISVYLSQENKSKCVSNKSVFQKMH